MCQYSISWVLNVHAGLPTLKYIAEAYLGRVWRGFSGVFWLSNRPCFDMTKVTYIFNDSHVL